MLKIANYINHKIAIRMTSDKGRGMFAARTINKGELVIVEKPIAIHLINESVHVKNIKNEDVDDFNFSVLICS